MRDITLNMIDLALRGDSSVSSVQREAVLNVARGNVSTMEQPKPSRWLKVSEVCEILKISRTTEFRKRPEKYSRSGCVRIAESDLSLYVL
jgi:hypothetical protein